MSLESQEPNNGFKSPKVSAPVSGFTPINAAKIPQVWHVLDLSSTTSPNHLVPQIYSTSPPPIYVPFLLFLIELSSRISCSIAFSFNSIFPS